MITGEIKRGSILWLAPDSGKAPYRVRVTKGSRVNAPFSQLYVQCIRKLKPGESIGMLNRFAYRRQLAKTKQEAMLLQLSKAVGTWALDRAIRELKSARNEIRKHNNIGAKLRRYTYNQHS